MHALGNDFAILSVNNWPMLTSEQICKLADRHRGIGFDQLLLIERIEPREQRCEYRIFNADGSEVWQCVNGSRCLAYYIAKHHGLKDTIYLHTQLGQYKAQLLSAQQVQLSIGFPTWQANRIPIRASEPGPVYTLNCGTERYEVIALYVGNPHLVLWVEEVEHYPVHQVGAMLAKHPQLPEGANVNVASVIDKQTIRLRTYERGVGETQACGSGACAAAVAGQLTGRLQDNVTVLQVGGQVSVHWDKAYGLRSTGSVSYVFDGWWLED